MIVVACAGGIRLFRYGSLHAHLLGLTAVLPNDSGTVLKLRSSLRKDNTTLQTSHMFLGSEGQVGIITMRMSPEAKKRKTGDLEKSFVDKDLVTNFMDSSIQHDRVVVVEGQKFYVTSGILSYSSEFFNSLFNGPFAEKNQREIVLEEVTVSDFQNFLSAIYPAFFEINDTNLLCLMELTARFLSPIVWKKCMKFLEPEEKFKQFDMADLLKWSEASNSNEFKERIENYLIETLSNKEKIISLQTVQLARDYNLEKVKEKIVMWLKNLLEDEAVSERSFAKASSIFVVLANETCLRRLLNMWKSAPRTPMKDYKGYFVAFIGRVLEHFKSTGVIKMYEGEPSSYRDMSKLHFDFHLKFFVYQLPSEEKTSELFTSVLQIFEKYNLPETTEWVIGELAEDFKKNSSFTHVDIAVKFNIVPLKKLMVTYIKKNMNSLTEVTMNILLNTSPEVTRFALEALIKKEIENAADVDPQK